MDITVRLDKDEVVEDWLVFRDAFEEAAEKCGLKIGELIHARSLND